MKKHFSKRLLSAFLAMLMLITSVPISAVTTFGADRQVSKYLFAYFTGNSQYGQQIRFALSKDGYNFVPLNKNKPIISHAEGTFDASNVTANTQLAGSASTSAGYARDPYIFTSPDGNEFYIIATDMDASSGGKHESWSGDTCMTVWKSTDLVDWYQISVINIAEISGFETTIRTWAPQVIYDESAGKYLIYWSNYLSDWSEGIYGAYTTDFKTIEAPQLIYKPDSGAAIDADIVYNSSEGLYYMYYKDESNATVGYVTSSSLTSGYSGFTSCTMTTNDVEGNSMYQIIGTDTWIMMLDEYTNGTFFLQSTTDFKNFTALNQYSYNLNSCSARHGSVIQITDSEYDALTAAYGSANEVGIVSYLFDIDEADASDSAGYRDWFYKNFTDSTYHEYDVAGQINYGLAHDKQDFPLANCDGGGGELNLYMSSVFINDSEAVSYLAGDAFTVSFDYTREVDTLTMATYSNDTPSYGTYGDYKNVGVLFALMQKDGIDYIRVLNNGTLMVYSGGAYITSTASKCASEGADASYTITYNGSSTVLYMNGEEINRIDAVIDPRSNHCASVGYSDGANAEYVAANGNLADDHLPRAIGILSNLKFYDKAFDVTEAQVGYYIPRSDLSELCDSFASMMSSGNAYTNMAEAYKYYNEAQRLLEIKNYGTADVSTRIEACYTNFKNAIEKMKLYNSGYNLTNLYTTYGKEIEVGGNILVQSGKSYIYSKQATNGWGEQTFFDKWGTKATGNVFGDSYAFLYTGKGNISAPVKTMFYRSTGAASSGCHGMYTNNTEFDWITQESGYIYLRAINDNNVEYMDYFWPLTYHERVSATTNGEGYKNTSHKGVHVYGYGYLKYNTSPTTYRTTITPSMSIKIPDGTTRTFTTPTYEIINIQPLIEKVENFATYIKGMNLSALDFTSAYAAMQEVDKLTAFDPYSYFTVDSNTGYCTKDNITSGSASCASQIETLVSNYKETDIQMDVDGYTALNTLRDNSAVNQTYAKGNVDPTDNSAIYNIDTWNSFTDAYNAAVNEVNKLADNMFETDLKNDGSANTTVSDVIENAYRAYYGLRKCADYSELRETLASEPVTTAVANTLGTVENQNYTIGTWIDFDSSYNTANTFNTNNPQSTEVVNYMYKDTTMTVNANGFTFENVVTDDINNYSEIQQECVNDNVALSDAVAALAPVDSDEAYQNYNSSQALFAKSDKDAYITDAVTAVTGYGTDTSALDYAKGLSAVYVSYNGDIYKNTTTGETDSYTSKVLTTINGGDESTNGNTRKSYTVTFNYVENGVVTQIVRNNEIHYYGDVVNMSYTGSGTVEGWDVTSGKSTPTSINNATNDFALKVQANTVVNVYATTPDNTRCVVKVLDYFGRARVAYVNPGTVATVSGETVSFNDGSTASITNQSCSYYTFNGFAVSGSMTDNGDGTYTINGDTVFTATGSKDKSAMNYTVTGGTFADGSTSAAYAMDDVITITPSIANCIGIALVTDSGYTMLSYGESSFTFYAFPVATAFGGAVQLACVAADDAKLTDNQKGLVPDSFGLGLRSSDGSKISKISMYCMMTTGASNAKIVERGIVITKSEKNEAQLIKGADGVTKFTSSSDVNSSQYLITIRTSASVWARSYVSYTVDTVVNGQTVNVPMVAYGEIQAIPAV